MSDHIAISISRDEALVLFEMLSRFSETNRLSICHSSEFIAISRISEQIDKALVEPFANDYPSRLDVARSRVASGFDGPAPGLSAEHYTESIECVGSPDEGVLFVKVVGMPQGYPVELDLAQAKQLMSRIASEVGRVEAGWAGGSSSNSIE